MNILDQKRREEQQKTIASIILHKLACPYFNRIGIKFESGGKRSRYINISHNYCVKNQQTYAQECEVFQRQFQGHNSPIVAHTKLKTSRIVSVQKSSLLGVFKCSHTQYTFEICIGRIGKKMSKVEILGLVFSTLLYKCQLK